MRQLRFNILRTNKSRTRCIERNISTSNASNSELKTISEIKGIEVKNKLFTNDFLYPEEEIIKRIAKDSKIENKELTYWRRLPDQPVSGVLKKDSSILLL